MLPALHTCPGSRSVSVPARTRQASRSSYVPGQPQRSNPGTYHASFPLFIRARPAAALQSGHVQGMFFALHTCLASHSAPIPARTRHACRSSYVPGKPRRSNPGTYQASFPLIFTCPASCSAPIRARARQASRPSYVPCQLQRSNPGTYQACLLPFIRARPAAADDAIGVHWSSGQV